MHRLKQRFLSAVEKKETSYKLKYEEIDMPSCFSLWVKDLIDRVSTVKIN